MHISITEQLDKDPSQYTSTKKIRIKTLGLKLGATKGEIVYWYESLANSQGYSTQIKDLSISKYKNILLDKVEDMLTIAGYTIDKVKMLISMVPSV
jgi:hypothetical protein